MPQIAEYIGVPQKLTHLDRVIFARNLVAQMIYECLKTGYFEKDLEMFSDDDQQRILTQLRLLARQLDAPGLSDENKKSKKKEKVHVP